MKRNKGVLCAFLAVFLFLFSIQPLAVEQAVGANNMSITVVYKDGETPLPGAVFKLFYVASSDSNGNLTVNDNFADYNVDLNSESAEAWQAAAATLEGYMLRDGITPDDVGTTNSEGVLVFSTDGSSLKPGLYLVTGESCTVNSKQYDPSPILVMLPSQSAEGGEVDYNPTIIPKFDFSTVPNPDVPDKEMFKVIKVWKDSGNESARPSEIIVDLLKDGIVFDTVRLSDGNNWTYKWESLDTAHRYTAVERTTENYTVTVEQQGTSLVITNTYSSNVPNEPTEPNEPTKPESPSEPTLPQTGQLWWPVPMLAVVGIALVLIGMIRRKNGKA